MSESDKGARGVDAPSDPRVRSAQNVIAQRLAGNHAAGSNQALERAIACVISAGGHVEPDAIALVKSPRFEKAIGLEPCEWCNVSVAECRRFTIEGDDHGCPGPELRALRARIVELEHENARLRPADPVREFQRAYDTWSGSLTSSNPISKLMEHAQRHNNVPPSFDFAMSGLTHMPDVTCRCVYLGRVTQAHGKSKKDTKNDAAAEMLKELSR